MHYETIIRLLRSGCACPDVQKQAAEEIERLRSLLKEFYDNCETCSGGYDTDDPDRRCARCQTILAEIKRVSDE